LFAGDCGDCKGLRELAQGVGTLVIACTYFSRPEGNGALGSVITGTSQVAEIAQESGAQRVVLTHVSPNFSRPGVKERAIAEVARTYNGSIFFPEELTTVDLST